MAFPSLLLPYLSALLLDFLNGNLECALDKPFARPFLAKLLATAAKEGCREGQRQPFQAQQPAATAARGDDRRSRAVELALGDGFPGLRRTRPAELRESVPHSTVVLHHDGVEIPPYERDR